MKRTLLFAIVLLTQTYPAMNGTAWGQWYVNPGSGPGRFNDGVANSSTNALRFGTNSLLYGNGFTPGAGLTAGSGSAPGVAPVDNTAASQAAATQGSDGSGDGGGGGAVGGSGSLFVSDPISAETTAVYSGMANLIRADGQYNQQTSKAMINYEQARSRYLNNQEQLFNTRRYIARASLSARAEDMENNNLANVRREAFLAAHRARPLGSHQLNPSNGQIEWPAVLLTTEFDDVRKPLEESFQARSQSNRNPELIADIKRQSHDLKEALLQHIREMPIENYTVARQFVDQLAASAE